MTMTQNSSRKACYTYGHGHLRILVSLTCLQEIQITKIIGTRKGVVTKGVFSLEESPESLKSLDSLESLKSLDSLESLNVVGFSFVLRCLGVL